MSGDIAAVLLRLPEADERTSINHIKQIAPIMQDRDVALLLDGHPEIVARSGADGAHLSDVETLSGAMGSLKPDRIAGAGGLHSRHDAMLAGEAGADYAMFGEPDWTGLRPSFDAIVERVSWWNEVFEIPCVAFAGNLDEVEPLGQAGADFIALSDYVWSDPRGPAAALASAVARLKVVEAV